MVTTFRTFGSRSACTFGTSEHAALTLSRVATGVCGLKCTTAHRWPRTASNLAQPARASQSTAAAAARMRIAGQPARPAGAAVRQAARRTPEPDPDTAVSLRRRQETRARQGPTDSAAAACQAELGCRLPAHRRGRWLTAGTLALRRIWMWRIHGRSHRGLRAHRRHALGGADQPGRVRRLAVRAALRLPGLLRGAAGR